MVVAAAVGQLVSLYLPWQAPNAPVRVHGFVVGGGADIDAWSPFAGAGEAAAVAALLLCGLGVAGIARPRLLGGVPLGLSALCASYLTLAVALGARLQAHSEESLNGWRFHYAAGTYLGCVAAVVSLVGVVAIRRPALGRYGSFPRLAMVGLAAAFLVVLLLPWTHVGSAATTLGVAPSPGIVAAVLALALIVLLPGLDHRGGLALSTAVLLFAAADLAAGPVSTAPADGAWIGLGLAAMLVVAALAMGGRALRLPSRVLPELALAALAALLVGSFFLPWVTFTGGSPSGDILTQNAWPSPAATASAVLVLMLVAATAAPYRLPAPAGLLSAGVVLFVASEVLELLDLVGPRTGRLGYGAVIGLAAAALIAGFALLRLRNRRFGRRLDLSRAWPIAACLILLSFLVVPSWHVLPFGVEGVFGYALLSWLSVVEAFGVLVLIALWSRQLVVARLQAWLVALPVGLLGLAVVDFFRNGFDGTRWDHGATVGLCALLAALGIADARVGIENVRFPEILRIDRL